MDNTEEIEVEVVEVVNGPAISPPEKTGTRHERPTNPRDWRPFGGMQARSLRIPLYLWPLAFVFALILLLLALAVAVVIAIPVLIIRVIVRLLRSARH